jgi:hypothetical protein
MKVVRNYCISNVVRQWGERLGSASKGLKDLQGGGFAKPNPGIHCI